MKRLLLFLLIVSPAYGQTRPLGSSFNSGAATQPLGSGANAVAIQTTPDTFDTSSANAIDATYRRLGQMAKSLPMKDRELFEHYLKGRLTGAMDVALVVAKAIDKPTAERFMVAGLRDLHGQTAKEFMASIQDDKAKKKGK